MRNRQERPTRQEYADSLEIHEVTNESGGLRTLVVDDPNSPWWGALIQRRTGPARAFYGNSEGVQGVIILGDTRPMDSLRWSIAGEVLKPNVRN